jgi:hypothetical protein
MLRLIVKYPYYYGVPLDEKLIQEIFFISIRACLSA